MSSFTAWSDEVVFRQGVESNSCLSLDGDRVSPRKGWLHGTVDALHSHVPSVHVANEDI